MKTAEMQEWSLALTYPALEAGDLKKMREFYRPPASQYAALDFTTFNEWRSGSVEASPSLDFRVKLQNFRRGQPVVPGDTAKPVPNT